MNQGYVRLWRKSLDAGWIRNHKLWAFWTYCLLKASYKEFDAIVGLQVVHLLPGQFIFGLRVASKETGLTIREIRTIIDFLRKAGNLTIKTTNKFSIISIVNWHIYQPQEKENDTLNDKQMANKGQHTRSKEVKNKDMSKNESFGQFDLFYEAYPIHQNHEAAIRAWKKLNPSKELLEIILSSIEKQKAYKERLKRGGQFCPEWPFPASWLNGRRWKDEIAEPQGTAKIPDNYFTRL